MAEMAPTGLDAVTLKDLYAAFADFQAAAGRARAASLRATFGKAMRQVQLCSDTRTEAILKRYPTPRALYDAYAALDTEEEKRALLKDVTYGDEGKKLGPKLAERIYHLYCDADYDQPQLPWGAAAKKPKGKGKGKGKARATTV